MDAPYFFESLGNFHLAKQRQAPGHLSLNPVILNQMYGVIKPGCVPEFGIQNVFHVVHTDYLCVRYVAGLQAELFYVREGVINEYALNFVVPVPAHINDLHFTWQSLAGRPVSIVHFFS